MEETTMSLSNLYAWGSNETPSAARGTACGAAGKPEEKPAACGAADKPEEKPAACGTACGAGDAK